MFIYKTECVQKNTHTNKYKKPTNKQKLCFDFFVTHSYPLSINLFAIDDMRRAKNITLNSVIRHFLHEN